MTTTNPAQAPAAERSLDNRPPVIAQPAVAEREAFSFYLEYCAGHGLAPLSEQAWRRVTRAGNRALAGLLEQGVQVLLPYRLGDFIIYRKKQDVLKLNVDWVKSKELGKRVYNFNDHSDGYYCTIHWSKVSCNFRNNSFFQFKLVRDVNRSLSQVMQQPGGYRTFQIKPEPREA